MSGQGTWVLVLQAPALPALSGGGAHGRIALTCFLQASLPPSSTLRGRRGVNSRAPPSCTHEGPSLGMLRPSGGQCGERGAIHVPVDLGQSGSLSTGHGMPACPPKTPSGLFLSHPVPYPYKTRNIKERFKRLRVSCCITSRKSPHPSGPQFQHLKNGQHLPLDHSRS